MQFYLKLGLHLCCGRPAPHILPISDIFLGIRGCCRSLRLASHLKPFIKRFSCLYRPVIWRKALWFEDLCSIQTGEGSKAAPDVYSAAPYQAHGSLTVQRRAQ